MLWSGARLTGDLIIEHNVDDHHIFPADYLNKRGVLARLRDCVLNRTLIDRTTIIRISNRAPSQYMKEIQLALGPAKFDELLRSHLLPVGPDSPFWQDDFEAFLEARQEALWREIKSATGVTEASDILAEEISA